MLKENNPYNLLILHESWLYNGMHYTLIVNHVGTHISPTKTFHPPSKHNNLTVIFVDDADKRLVYITYCSTDRLSEIATTTSLKCSTMQLNHYFLIIAP